MSWWRHTCRGHVARVDRWGYLYDPWVSRYFSVFWALVFKLTFPFVSPFTFSNFFNHWSESLLLHFALATVSTLFWRHPLNFSDCAIPFQGVFLFSFSSISFFFIIFYKFLNFPFSFLCYGCFCFLAFGTFVFTSIFCIFSRCL